jgi:glycerol-3-phosphate acyltransferase PlsX
MLSLKDKTCDACVSAGPTQCVIVGAHLFVRKLDGMQRVALCPIIPSMDGQGRLLLDVGANVELRPEHLKELAIAATIVSREILGVRDPKIGLINIGSEEGKGREVDQETYELLKNSPEIDFAGNVEPNEILTTKVNVLLTDGFSGNLVLKTVEGTAKAMGAMLKEEIYSSLSAKIAGLILKKKLNHFKKRLDSSEVGGAMILGAKAPVVKAHGSSDPKAFKNAIGQARLMVLNQVVEKVKANLPKKVEE